LRIMGGIRPSPIGGMATRKLNDDNCDIIPLSNPKFQKSEVVPKLKFRKGDEAE
jgi:hypothetical protein